MEALGIGLQALGSAIVGVAGWIAVTCISTIAATAFLIYHSKITLEDIKQLIKKDKWR